MTSDQRHIELLRQLEDLYDADASLRSTGQRVVVDHVRGRERDQWCSLAAAAASQMNDTERLYAHWRERARDDTHRRAIEDRIARVRR